MDYVREHVRPLASMLDVCLTLEPCFSQLEDLIFLDSADYAVLLGKTFNTSDIELIREFSRSILWFTYRRNWPAPIGGFGGPTSDRGWGCMIRCGQMLLAQCLTLIHLGPNWCWSGNKSDQPHNEFTTNYKRILRMFQDKRTAQYSIHQIAQMGVSEGKQVGQWIGPNTMAQVLKKLVLYDNWSQLVVHVAMDNVLISSDVHIVAAQQLSKERTTGEQLDLSNNHSKKQEPNHTTNQWRHPLLLIIPLRLGLTGINACYLNAVMEYFKLPQCVGILGGRPNHAVYFYGVAADKFLYLDPHVCQDFQDLDSEKTSLKETGQNLSEPTSCTSPPACSSSDELIQSVNGNQTHSPFFNTSLPQSTDCFDMSIVNMSTSTATNTKDRLLTSPSGTLPPIPSSNGSHCFCSSSSSCCSIDNQQRGAATTISFPTSSSISKLSSQSGGCCRSRSFSPSEPEMPLDPVMNRFIDSFAGPSSTLIRRKNNQFDGGNNEEFNVDLSDEREENDEKGSQKTELEATIEARRKHSFMDQIDYGTPNQKTCLDGNPIENLFVLSSFDDSSFHCPYLLSMDFASLDPSLALGFFIRDADDYADLINRLRNDVLPSSTPPLFEIIDARPRGWPEFSLEPSYLHDESINIKEYDDLQYESDEQFELLE